MRQTSVERLHGRLDVLQTSFPPPPSWIQDGGAGNDINQDLGYFFRSLLWRWRKMAALPLPAAILDDLICGNRKWGHPRWRPEAEGPPSCATATMGVEKSTLYYLPSLKYYLHVQKIPPEWCQLCTVMFWNLGWLAKRLYFCCMVLNILKLRDVTQKVHLFYFMVF